jgi:phytoene/squalene synthetase
MLDFLAIIFPVSDYFSDFTKKESPIFFVATSLDDKIKQNQIRLVYSFYKKFTNLSRGQEVQIFNSLCEKFLDCRDKTTIYQFKILDGVAEDALVESVVFLEKELNLSKVLINKFLSNEAKLMAVKNFQGDLDFDRYFFDSTDFVVQAIAKILNLSFNQTSIFRKLFIAGEVLDFLRKATVQGYFLNKVIPEKTKKLLGWSFSEEEILLQPATAEKIFDQFWSRYSTNLDITPQKITSLETQTKILFLKLSQLLQELATKIKSDPSSVFRQKVNLNWHEIIKIAYQIEKSA